MQIDVSPGLLIASCTALGTVLMVVCTVTWRLSSIAKAVAQEALDADVMDERVKALEEFKTLHGERSSTLAARVGEIHKALLGENGEGGLSYRVSKIWTHLFSNPRMRATRPGGSRPGKPPPPDDDAGDDSA